jgi:hypothetical protein
MDSNHRFPASGQEVRFALDSPLEGAGFEPSVPRQKDNAFRELRFAPDSPLEGTGFEPSVPL